MGIMKPASDVLWALRKHYRVTLVEAEAIMADPDFKAAVRSGRMADAARTRLYDYPKLLKWCETHDVDGNVLEAPVELAAALQVPPSEHEARVVERAGRKELVEPGKALPDRAPYLDGNGDPAAYKAWLAARKQRAAAAASASAKASGRPPKGSKADMDRKRAARRPLR